MTEQEHFKDSILHIKSKAELDAFIETYSLSKFNSSLNLLGNEDYRRVLGRIESIRIDAVYNSQQKKSNISDMLNFKDTTKTAI